MFRTILVVCVGNICRSPVGERLLAAGLPDLSVSSAGLGALVGHAADETAQEVAQAHGLSLEGHVARQFSVDLGQAQDLILVMEPGHKREIIRIAPHLSGKTMLFDQWTGGAGIADPYRRSREFHEHVFESISKAAETWISRLGASKR
jgi:protein-tyrosine phosphatase